MTKPLFTIAIPSFNRLNYLKEAINSVLNQSFRDFELIIIDDCSTENIWEYLLTIKDERVKIFRNSKNLGIAPNWRRCIEEASVKWFKFLMADDVMFKDSLFILNNLINKYPENKVIVTSGIDFKNIFEIEDYLKTNNRNLVDADKFLIPMEKIINLRKRFIQTWAMPNSYTLLTKDLKELIKSKTYQEVEKNLGKTGHCVDYFILYSIAIKYKTMIEMDVPLYGVRNHETNFSKTYNQNLLYHLSGDKYIHYMLYSYKGIENLFIIKHAFKIYFNKILSNKRVIFSLLFFKWTFQLFIFLFCHLFGIKVTLNN